MNRCVLKDLDVLRREGEIFEGMRDIYGERFVHACWAFLRAIRGNTHTWKYLP
jgi:hypothetical protein